MSVDPLTQAQQDFLDGKKGKSMGTPLVPVGAMAQGIQLGTRLADLEARVGTSLAPAAVTVAAATITFPDGANDVIATGVGGSVDVTTLAGLAEGQRFSIQLADAAKNIVLKHTGGNLVLPGATDITLDAIDDVVTGLVTADGKYTVTGMSVAASLPANLSTALASTANGQGASLVGIEDPLLYITAATVEGATAEIAAVTSDVAGAVDGLHAVKVARVTFDPSAVSGQRTIAAHASAVSVPAKAIITRAYYQVKTTFTSATDAGTVAISIEGANDVVAAIAISDGTNPWDAGLAHEGKEDGTAAKFIQASVSRAITFTVAVEALTAGKLVLFVEYVLGV